MKPCMGMHPAERIVIYTLATVSIGCLAMAAWADLHPSMMAKNMSPVNVALKMEDTNYARPR